MSYTKRLKYEPIRSVDTSTLSGAYVALGTPLAHPCSLIKLVNNSNVLASISIDGTTQVDVAPANSFFLYDITSNTPSNGDDAIFISQGTQYLVSAPTGSGLIYLVVQYIEQV